MHVLNTADLFTAFCAKMLLMSAYLAKRLFIGFDLSAGFIQVSFYTYVNTGSCLKLVRFYKIKLKAVF